MSSSLVFLPQSHAAGSRPRVAKEAIHASDVYPAPTGDSRHARGAVPTLEVYPCRGAASMQESHAHAREPTGH